MRYIFLKRPQTSITCNWESGVVITCNYSCNYSAVITHANYTQAIIKPNGNWSQEEEQPAHNALAAQLAPNFSRVV